MLLKFSLVIVFVYLVVQSIYTYYYLSITNKLVKASFNNTTTVGNKNNPEFRLFISGDSVAVGVGASTFEKSVAGRVATYYAKIHYVSYENQAISGSRMGDLLNMPLPHVKQDVILLIISSNDVVMLTDSKKFEEQTKAVITRYLPHTNKLIIIGPGRVFDGSALPMPLRMYYRWMTPKYVEILEHLTEESRNITYINPIAKPISKAKYGYVFAADKFHPNDAGYAYWFDMLLPALN